MIFHPVSWFWRFEAWRVSKNCVGKKLESRNLQLQDTVRPHRIHYVKDSNDLSDEVVKGGGLGSMCSYADFWGDTFAKTAPGTS